MDLTILIPPGWLSPRNADAGECQPLTWESLALAARPGCWRNYLLFLRQSALRDSSRPLRSPTAKAKSSTSQWARAMDTLASRPAALEALVTIRSLFRAATKRALLS